MRIQGHVRRQAATTAMAFLLILAGACGPHHLTLSDTGTDNQSMLVPTARPTPADGWASPSYQEQMPLYSLPPRPNTSPSNPASPDHSPAASPSTPSSAPGVAPSPSSDPGNSPSNSSEGQAPESPTGGQPGGNIAQPGGDPEASAPTSPAAPSGAPASSCTQSVDPVVLELIAALPEADPLLGLHQLLSGYWASGDTFIGFVPALDGIGPGIRFGIFNSGYARQAGYVSASPVSTTEYTMTVSIPASPGTELLPAIPASTTTISIDMCNWADRRINASIEDVHEGQWMTYDTGGIMLENQVDQIFGG